jgi:hypothetical protein
LAGVLEIVKAVRTTWAYLRVCGKCHVIGKKSKCEEDIHLDGRNNVYANV